MCCGYCTTSEVDLQKFNKEQEINTKEDRHKIVPNHAYAIINMIQDGKTNMLELRNPWGRLNTVSSLESKTGNNNGCFTISFRDWYKSFNTLYVCTLQDYLISNSGNEEVINTCKKSFQSRWTDETAGGCSLFPNWRLNPTFTLAILDENIKKCYITISQTDKRTIRKKTSSLNEFEKLDYENKIGIEVIMLKENTCGPEIVNGKYNIVKKSSYWNKRDVSIELKITKDIIGNDLIVIPSTYFPNKLGSFSIISEIEVNDNIDVTKINKFIFERRMFGNSGDVQLPIDDDTGKIALNTDAQNSTPSSNKTGSNEFSFAYKYCGEWNDKTAGGPPHGLLFHKNPQYQINVNSKTKVILLLSQQQQAQYDFRMNKKTKESVCIDKIGIGLSAYRNVECLNNIEAVEKLAAQTKFQIGDPVLMKALEISKVIEVTPKQNPILVSASVQKGKKGKFILNVLTSQPISIRSAPQNPSKRQLDLIEAESKDNTITTLTKKGAKTNNSTNNKGRGNSGKKKKSKIPVTGSFMSAKKNMNAMGDLYSSLE